MLRMGKGLLVAKFSKFSSRVADCSVPVRLLLIYFSIVGILPVVTTHSGCATMITKDNKTAQMHTK